MAKTALGATDTVDWIHYTSAVEAVNELKQKGYTVFSIEQAVGSISLEKFDTKNYAKIAVVMGNEVEGVQQEVIEASDGCIEIPQLGMKHSLNVSTAAGVILWKLVETRLINK
jgi:tRNA G18 (ribose-2'-O)-methylase SpoU